MKQKDYLDIVPLHYTGKEIEADADIELDNNDEARTRYAVAKQRLQDVNQWHAKVGFMSATFRLHNANGLEINRYVEPGDYIRVDIPGPGSNDGGGYDWVLVEEVKNLDEEDVQSFGLRVRPAANPHKSSGHIAHFYSNESTSTFMVSRQGNKVSAFIIDRNTKANDNSETITDQLRHSSVAMSAIGMFSKAQWQSLANGLLASDEAP